MKDLDQNPAARVFVFVDGQNLYKRSKELFGHALCHPHLLAEHLAGPRSFSGTRFYTGRPDPNRQPAHARNLDRRLAGMRASGVTVVQRPLRYHWEWAPSGMLGRPSASSQPQMAEMHAWRRPQEKGIDLVLGLDVVEFALRAMFDVGIIVSLDRDLHEIPQALLNIKDRLPRSVRLEAAVPVSGKQRSPKLLPNFAHTHQITPEVFEHVRDDTNYAVDDSQWKQPGIPRSLSDVQPKNLR